MNPDPGRVETASKDEAGIHHDAANLPANPGKTPPEYLRAPDVLLVSYPRSGNTWMRYLLANLFFPHKSWNIENISQVIPDLGEDFPKKYLAPHPRIFKTHYPRLTRHRAIYLYRDGRDAALSYYDRLCKLRAEERPFGAFLQEMLLGGCKFGSWQDHVDSWISGVESGRVLPVCYESLRLDLEKELLRVGEFLEINWSRLQIRRAGKRSNRERMRRHLWFYRKQTHWRKGYTGGINREDGYWRQVLSEKQRNLFWDYAGDTAARLGYSRR